jgi:hypothetical protein
MFCVLKHSAAGAWAKRLVLKGEFFFSLHCGQKLGAKKRAKKIREKGQKKEQPFRFFWATAKKTEKLRQKNCPAPTQIAELPCGAALKSFN